MIGSYYRQRTVKKSVIQVATVREAGCLDTSD